MSRSRIVGTVRSMLLNCLSSIKDEEYQKRVWFGDVPDADIVDSYIDSVDFFLSRCERLFESPDASKVLGKEIYQQLKELYQLVKNHLYATEREMDVDLLKKEDLLNDPKWRDIKMLAGVVYDQLTDFIRREEHV